MMMMLYSDSLYGQFYINFYRSLLYFV